jgi:hypothetical protein
MFSIMEVLIIALAPAMVALMVALHAWAPADAKVLTLTSLIFMSLLAGVTTSLHFAILTLSRHAAFAHRQWSALVFSFKWPSVAYALDIFAWDFFFALSVLFAAGAFPHAKTIRSLLILSGVLALAGLSGVAFNDMRLRDIGIVGYVIVFPIAATLIAIMFYRTRTV